MARFGEVARESVFWDGGTIGDAGVVAIVCLVGTSHYSRSVSESLGVYQVVGGVIVLNWRCSSSLCLAEVMG